MKGRHIYGFDSFAGLPDPTDEDYGSPQGLAKKGLFGSASSAGVFATLRSCGFNSESIEQMITLRKGWFSDSLPSFQEWPIALLHIDADLYESYKTCLEVLWDKMAVNGVIVFDEYHRPNRWPGAKAAVDEFHAKHQDDMKLCEDPRTGRFYAVKLK